MSSIAIDLQQLFCRSIVILKEFLRHKVGWHHYLGSVNGDVSEIQGKGACVSIFIESIDLLVAY